MKHTIFLVDDNDDDYLILHFAVRDSGAELERVSSAVDAERYLRRVLEGGKSMPLLMLVDFRLRSSSGFDVLVWVRERERFKSLPVLMFSSSVREEDLRRAMDLGADGFCDKDINLRDPRLFCRNLLSIYAERHRNDSMVEDPKIAQPFMFDFRGNGGLSRRVSI